MTLLNRIQNYLESGGLFNPELMEHDKVRDLLLDIRDYLLVQPNLEYYTVENTGWSNGISWFPTGGTVVNPLRFNTLDEARSYGLTMKADLNQDDTLWRIVHTSIVRETAKETSIKEYTPL